MMTIEEARKLKRRAARAARTLTHGSNILAHLEVEEVVAQLLEGVDEGVPPVSKVSHDLLEHFGSDIRQMPVRQFIGMAVKAILAENGCEIEDSGVRIFDDPVFSTGSTYTRAPAAEDPVDDGDLLRAMIRNLNVRELERLAELVEEERL